ncbi:hypothetical protein NA57DRAFT_73537 [Rhizodiscina lignyota]|uniref:Uncharacterized protein n=1 Tax=Rhizodiscina lignyota TaxID=1504668 RepID=A0A9P4M9H0_9PEZI|nr:hypothetical protein NA57DRAFT_73537 [Rhizodiscina lignyota]
MKGLTDAKGEYPRVRYAADAYAADNSHRRQGLRPLFWIFPWVTTSLLLLLSLYLSVKEIVRLRTELNTTLRLYHKLDTDIDKFGSFSTGWKTDFGAAKTAIEVERVRFKGSPAFRSDGSVYVPHPGPIDYVGEPSPELDEQWDKLLHNNSFMITEEEARATWPEEWVQAYSKMPEGESGYLVELDMFHTLDCLNEVRKMLYPKYYGAKAEYNEFKDLHKGHCIDQIRQHIMCSGDLTPVPTKSYDVLDGVSVRYVNSNYPHTCRNFDSIRNWVDERVVRYDRERNMKKLMHGDY